MNDKILVNKINGYQLKAKISGIVVPVLVVMVQFALLMLVLEVVGTGRRTHTYIIFVVAAIILIFIFNKSGKKAKTQLKECVGEYVVKDILAEKIDIKDYDPTSRINEKVLKKSCILPHYDRISGSDYIKGFYKGAEIAYSDILLEQEHTTTDSDGHKSTTYETVFHGHFIKVYLGKTLDNYLKIMERKNKGKKSIFYKAAEVAAGAMGIQSNNKTVELENVEFNNRFEVKTDNEEFAFYILTPNFMESIIRVDEYAQGYTNICFKEDAVYVAINSGYDSFEAEKLISSKKRLEELRTNVRNDILFITAVIDELLGKERLFEK